MAPIMNFLPVTSESKLSPPPKKMRLQKNIAAMSNYTCYAKKQLSSAVKKICVDDKVIEEQATSEYKLSPPAKKIHLKKNTAKKEMSSAVKICVEDKIIEVQASSQHIDISSSKSSLYNWQELQQDEQVVKPIPSFEPVNDLTGRGVSTQHQSRQNKNSSKHKHHISAGNGEKPFEQVVKPKPSFKSVKDLTARDVSTEGLCRYRKTSSKHKRHISAGTGEKPFVCNICGEGFTRKPNFDQHQRVHSYGGIPCPICDKVFQNTDDRLIHVLTQECTRGFRHLKRIDNAWHCLKCDAKDFVKREQAESHARRHEQGKGMPCPVCSQDFQGDKAKDLFRHVKKQHREFIHDLLL